MLASWWALSRPAEAPGSRSYSLFGLTPGTSVAVMSSTELEERDQVVSSPNLTRRLALVFLVVPRIRP